MLLWERHASLPVCRAAAKEPAMGLRIEGYGIIPTAHGPGHASAFTYNVTGRDPEVMRPWMLLSTQSNIRSACRRVVAGYGAPRLVVYTSVTICHIFVMIGLQTPSMSNARLHI